MFSHTVNLLGNLPLMCLDVLLTPKVRPGSLEYMGVNMDAVSVLLDFLERRLDRVGRGDAVQFFIVPSFHAVPSLLTVGQIWPSIPAQQCYFLH